MATPLDLLRAIAAHNGKEYTEEVMNAMLAHEEVEWQADDCEECLALCSEEAVQRLAKGEETPNDCPEEFVVRCKETGYVGLMSGWHDLLDFAATLEFYVVEGQPVPDGYED